MTPVLLIHGGAGAIARGEATREREAAIRAALQAALDVGSRVLEGGGAAFDAIEGAVRSLEDSPFFNAGHGAALTSEGTIEHDACIMDGTTLAAGAVCGVGRIRNPVQAARAVMDRTRHVLLTGAGAELFAREQGLPLAAPWYFFTPERRDALLRVQAARAANAVTSERDRHGTVGAVALDAQGRLAAATSTGGYTDKKPGRVGDSPLVGAGTFADARVAFSGTGHGESFIKTVLGHRLFCLMELAGLPLAEAATRALDELGAIGGTGGFIAVDAQGTVALPFNTPGMYRGIARGGRIAAAIFGDEVLDA
ncbi:MAG TPA: isoaspartyl peptidase/L-asparaginase [Beijerinckiaceae bacterium]|jgi:beta-aspartyl-peptidase (threonine type)